MLFMRFEPVNLNLQPTPQMYPLSEEIFLTMPTAGQTGILTEDGAVFETEDGNAILKE